MKWTSENSAVIRAIDELKNNTAYESIRFDDVIPAKSLHFMPEGTSGKVTADMVVDGEQKEVFLLVPAAWHNDIPDEAVTTTMNYLLVGAFIREG